MLRARCMCLLLLGFGGDGNRVHKFKATKASTPLSNFTGLELACYARLFLLIGGLLIFDLVRSWNVDFPSWRS
jgi:hypothetical protein